MAANESMDTVLAWFRQVGAAERNQALRALLDGLPFDALSVVKEYIDHLLQRDFLSLLPSELRVRILQSLDARDLCAVEGVCQAWNNICHAHGSELWGRLCALNGWDPQFYVLPPGGGRPEKLFYKHIYGVERNWTLGRYRMQKFEGHRRAVFAVQLADEHLYSSSFDNTIKIWDLPSGALLRTLEGHQGGVSCVRMQNQVLASGSSDTTIKIWDAESGECLRTLHGHTHEVTTLYHDGAVLVSGSCDGTVRVWEVSSGECVAVLQGHTDYVINVQFDDDIIASASFDKTVKVWDRKTHAELFTLHGHTMGVKCVRFDANVIATASLDKTVRVWDRHTGQEIAVLTGHSDEVWTVQLLYTGWGSNVRLHKLVSGGRDGIRVWRVRPRFECELAVATEKGVTCIDVDPCTVVVSSFDKSIMALHFDN